MREWNLRPGDPLSLVLAADSRLGTTDYCNDQIWELVISAGEPPALALQTTFGLRARMFRMFPRFTLQDVTLTDPADFVSPPVIHHFYPNYLLLSFSPFNGIDVEAEYWVPHSHGIAGRLIFHNENEDSRQVRLEWVGQLTPTEGQRMSAMEIQAAPVLMGQTGNLTPVVFLTGGPQPGAGSYPALSINLDLGPGKSHKLTWAQAALSSPEESFQKARELAARKWEAERARIDLLNASQVDIYTGNTDWDAAFALAQKTALGLFVGPGSSMPCPSFVYSRQPDHGFSLRGDGSDYNHLWNGQSPLEAYYLTSLMLPSAPQLAAGLVRNFLAVQDPEGFIDWKPGPSGQQSRLLATPLLASLAWRIYETLEDRSFLADVFPGLLKFVHSWFNPQHDRDGDGVPEWDHSMQSGFEDSPIYSRWQTWSQGVEISTSESPALCAFLYRECQALIRMTQELDQPELIPALESIADHMQSTLELAWDPEEYSYYGWDRDTHTSEADLLLGERQGPGEILVNQNFDHPVRLLLRILTNGEATRRPQLFIHGTGASNNHRVEHILDNLFRWHLGAGTMTGEHVYTGVERIEILGLDPDDQVSLHKVGFRYQEISNLLPLWAGMPDEKLAAQLVENTLTNPLIYWRQYGLPSCARPPDPAEAVACQSANLTWNQLIGEGLVQYGFRAEAAELVTHLMNAITSNLKQERAFRRYYHADNGQGAGERNALHGLAPVGLFLDALGVRLISSWRVALTGSNPFPWPVTVKYRGLTVLRQKEKTMVIFPDGQTTVVENPDPCIVSLETE